MLRRILGWRLRLLAALATIVLLMGPLSVRAAGGTDNKVARYSGLSAGQRAVLYSIARDTWKFYSAYTDTTGITTTFVPTWGGGMFEAEMANMVVPETSWGARSFGLNDLRNAQVQMQYATHQLHYPVWGLSPSSTPDDTGGYATYGVEGLVFPYHGGGADASHPNLRLSQCHGCNTETVVTPHASFLALDVLPQEAFANIQALRTLYPGIYGPYGFFDAVNPTTGSIGHRYLVLDQSMIMAALDNALDDRAMQQHFAHDPVSCAAQRYLSFETMSIQ